MNYEYYVEYCIETGLYELYVYDAYYSQFVFVGEYGSKENAINAYKQADKRSFNI